MKNLFKAFFITVLIMVVANVSFALIGIPLVLLFSWLFNYFGTGGFMLLTVFIGLFIINYYKFKDEDEDKNRY